MSFENISLASTDMYLDHFQLNRSPFLDESEPQIFFTDAGRDDILRSLYSDLREGKPLMKVIGGEGSGKTLTCKQLAISLPDYYQVVFITNPLGSFEDLLRIICRDLGLDAEAETKSEEIAEYFRHYLNEQKNEGRTVLIIIDEAEKLFLATLERLIRIICELGKEDLFHILLAGRPGLESNIEQLSDFSIKVDINTAYTLNPLNLEETGLYLRFRLTECGASREEAEQLFTDEAVLKIFESGKGNLRHLNTLAEEAMQHACQDNSPVVRGDHVGAPANLTGRSTRDYEGQRGEPFTLNRIWLTLGVGLFVVLLVTYFNTPKEEHPGETGSVTHTELPSNQTKIIEPDSQTEEQAGNVTSEVSPQEPLTSGQDTAPISTAEPARPITTKKPDGVKPSGESNQVTIAPLNNGRSAEKIYAQLRQAGERWIKSTNQNQYTIQLMMLTSREAEANLKKLLIEDEYFRIRNDIFILTKKISPPTIFVFFGTYATMEEARNVRNNLPMFLRQHHPYALAIKDAVNKTEE